MKKAEETERKSREDFVTTLVDFGFESGDLTHIYISPPS